MTDGFNNANIRVFLRSSAMAFTSTLSLLSPVHFCKQRLQSLALTVASIAQIARLSTLNIQSMCSFTVKVRFSQSLPLVSGCRCYPLLIELILVQDQIKPIDLPYYLVPWMAVLVALHLLMKSHFADCSLFRESLFMLYPMLLASIPELSDNVGQAERPIGLALTV
ncbi:hypothetical protein E2542_SST26771 [Spatholobus suberectus]|nr:hypothetical protein E2542_SST26771 [Spatholobus suberectus]